MVRRPPFHALSNGLPSQHTLSSTSQKRLYASCWLRPMRIMAK